MKLGLLVGIPPERMQLLESRFNSIVQPDLESGDLSQRFREFLEVEGDQSPINRLLKAANQVLSLSVRVCAPRACACLHPRAQHLSGTENAGTCRPSHEAAAKELSLQGIRLF